MGRKRPFNILENESTLFVRYKPDRFLYCGQWEPIEADNFTFESGVSGLVYDGMLEIFSGEYTLEFFEPNEGVLSRYPFEKSPELSTDKAELELVEDNGRIKQVRLIW